MPKIPKTWCQDERIAAELFARAWGIPAKRVILSGSNNRRDDGTPHHGDVVFPDGYNIHLEAKRRAAFMHQKLFDTAKKDAEKHGLDPHRTILVTKQLRQQGFTYMMDEWLFEKLISLPGAKEIFLDENPK